MPNRPEPPAETPSAIEPPLRAGETLRRIALGERLVAYRLRRARRRTIGLTIDRRGLSVGAPLRASLGEIERLIHRHADWVTRKLDEWQARPATAALPLADGVRLPLLGHALTLRLSPGNDQIAWIAPDSTHPILALGPRRPEDAPALLEEALRERAHAHFADRLVFFTARLGLPVPPLALTAARTRWGSCSRISGIRLNWRLIHFPPALIDYVVAHEVAHLLEMNHGPRFWAVVERLCPEHASARAELRRHAAVLPAGFLPPT